MQFKLINKFTGKEISWTKVARGARSVDGYLPMTALEAETFQDMLTRGVLETMSIQSVYRIDNDDDPVKKALD